MDWFKFDTGQTLGKKGSEDGTIIDDQENVNGARVTLEQNGSIAPFSVTVGIYGLMFHTHFSDSLTQAQKYLDFAKFKIDQVFVLYKTPDKERDTNWKNKFNLLMEEIVEQKQTGG